MEADITLVTRDSREPSVPSPSVSGSLLHSGIQAQHSGIQLDMHTGHEKLDLIANEGRPHAV